MKCSYCGKDISDDSEFCGYCGKKIKNIKKSKRIRTTISVIALIINICILIAVLINMNDIKYMLLYNKYEDDYELGLDYCENYERFIEVIDTIEKSGIRVFVMNEATDKEIAKFGEELKQIKGVRSVKFVSKEEAYNQMKKGLGEREGVMEGLDSSIFPASYMVELTNISKFDDVEKEIKKLDNFKKITSNYEWLEIGMEAKNTTEFCYAIIVTLICIFIVSDIVAIILINKEKEKVK